MIHTRRQQQAGVQYILMDFCELDPINSCRLCCRIDVLDYWTMSIRTTASSVQHTARKYVYLVRQVCAHVFYRRSHSWCQGSNTFDHKTMCPWQRYFLRGKVSHLLGKRRLRSKRSERQPSHRDSSRPQLHHLLYVEERMLDHRLEISEPGCLLYTVSRGVDAKKQPADRFPAHEKKTRPGPVWASTAQVAWRGMDDSRGEAWGCASNKPKRPARESDARVLWWMAFRFSHFCLVAKRSRFLSPVTNRSGKCPFLSYPFWACTASFIQVLLTFQQSLLIMSAVAGARKKCRILDVSWMGHTRYSSCLEESSPCAGGLSAVNAIGTQLRDPIKSGLTRWRLMVAINAVAESGRASEQAQVPAWVWRMSGLMQNTTAEPGSRDKILRRERTGKVIIFLC